MKDNLKSYLSKQGLEKANEIRNTMRDNEKLVVDNVELGQLYGGLRDVIALFSDISELDPEKGITYRGHFLKDMLAKIPENKWNSKTSLAEGVFVLLLTGNMPTTEDVHHVNLLWKNRGQVPSHVFDVIRALPDSATPMTKFATAIASLETGSVFNKAYKDGIRKENYWEYTYEDAMNIISCIPHIVAYIYNQTYSNKHIDSNPDLDWAGNLAHMLGDEDNSDSSMFKEFMRLYTTLHADHESGNASAHTCHLVGSTLASPQAALSAAMMSLSGPLHGLACQTSLEWIEAVISHYGKIPSAKDAEDYINLCLSQGRVIPGYGHAVLRNTDPRFSLQMDFCKKHGLTSDLLETVWSIYEIAPNVLKKTGKIKNPYPNVDSHSGACLKYFGIQHPEFYTVLFGASRTIGVMVQQIWDRLLMLPINRPRSVSYNWVKDKIANSK